MTRRAFSLIEVLISVVVLGLGLLGLAAVFPVVLAQQRSVTDASVGVSVERSAVAFLRGAVTRANEAGNTNAAGRRGWNVLLGDTQWSRLPTGSRHGPWTTATISAGASGQAAGFGMDPTDGALYLGGSASHLERIPVGARLSPTPYTSEAQPRFVWDFVPRRVDQGRPGTDADDAVQVAVFVRRLDAGLRLSPGVTLSDALTGGMPGAPATPDQNRRVAVAVDASGRPANDGVGVTGRNYSPIVQAVYRLDPGDLTKVDFQNTPLRPFLLQIGQQFVDQIGEVHRVVQVVGGGTPYAVVEPALSSELTRVAGDQGGAWMLATPHLPAAVSVLTIERR
jgi:prepilin-type N-terminal cleavage/methylation domain-containing protein